MPTKTKYKFIEFVKAEDECPEVILWHCRNRKHWDALGDIVWYPTWRCHVFQPTCSEFSASCFLDIADFLKQLDEERKA